ncbi:MAG: DUF4184 family protein, partial [Angustibacter sp.]
AAVLPLRSGRTRVEALPTAPLVIGSMVPDLPAVLGAADLRPVTHSGPFALVVDLALTAVLWCAWVAVLRPAVVSTLPEVAARWRPAPRRRPASLWWVVAAVVGAVTHLLWDAFTHSSEGATWFDAFAEHERVFLVLQVVSSAVGLLVVLAWARRWWSSTPADLAVAERGAWAPRPLLATVVLIGVAGGGLWRWQHPAAVTSLGEGDSLTVSDVVFGTLGGALLAVAVLTVTFWVWRWRGRAPVDGGLEPREPASEQVTS